MWQRPFTTHMTSTPASHGEVPASAFPTLPDLPEGPGAPRRVGVELEFGALAPADAAAVAAAELGGTVRQISASEWRVTRDGNGNGDGNGDGAQEGPGGETGGDAESAAREPVRILLDTAFRPETRSWAADAGVALARQVVPIEVVTAPVAQAALPELDRLVDALRHAGAEGSRSHVVHGFGLHFNVALADPEHGRDLPRVTRAFALLERWFRARDRLAIARRVLPFTQPFPPAFVDAVAHLPVTAAPGEVFDIVDAEIASRNHGLDLLPVYAALAPERFSRHPGASAAVSGRPAYHYRLPESRVDEPAWSLGYEWRRWWLVERVAAEPEMLDRLAEAWDAARDAFFLSDPGEKVDAVTEILGPLAALAPEGGPAPDAGGAVPEAPGPGPA
jgi:hypothetical protein